MKFYATLALASTVILLLAEVAPEAVNAFLILLLMGIILGRYQSFEKLASGITGAIEETI